MRQKPASQPAPRLQRDAIVQAALRVLDRDGLEGLTQRNVAKELNVQAPALYWHFKNKTALIDHMAEAILQAEFTDFAPRREDETWQEWLMAAMQKLRKAMWSHRDGGRVVAGAHLSPALTLVRLFELSLESLVSAGIGMKSADLIISTATHFVFGRVIEEQSGPTPEQQEYLMKRMGMEELFAGFPLFLESNKSNMAGEGIDEFEESLRLIIDGAAVRIAAK